MLKKLTFFILIMGAIFLLPAPVFASGEVQIKNPQPGVMYLGTELATGSANASLSAITTNSNGIFGPLVPPVGFIPTITELLNLLLKVTFVIAAVLVFVFLIWGAIEWITSGGEKAKTDAARNRMVSAIIGLVIVVSSFAIMTLIVRILGFNSINDVLLMLSPTSQTATDSSQLREQNLVQ